MTNRIETGQGMAATLKIASEKKGYTLTDRATFLAQKANLQLAILVEKDPALLNVYHVITVNPAEVSQDQSRRGQGLCRLHHLPRDPDAHRPVWRGEIRRSRCSSRMPPRRTPISA